MTQKLEKLSEADIKTHLERLAEWSEIGGEIQRTFEFGEGREANAYLRDGWPEWREVSWHSSDEAFYVGLGRGAGVGGVGLGRAHGRHFGAPVVPSPSGGAGQAAVGRHEIGSAHV